MSSTGYSVERMHPRYTLDARAKLTAGAREITVRTLDVSEVGLGLISPEEIPEKGPCAVEFVFPTMQETFHAQIQVYSRNGFRYGFKFVELDERNLALLRKYQRRWGIRANED